MRLFTAIVLVGMTIACVAAVWAGPPPAEDAAQGSVTLLGTLAEWKYPESKMLGGASMSDGGNPSLPSVKFQAILTTDDPVQKVVDFYSRKFETSRDTGLQDVAAQVKAADAKTVSNQDDSDGRPLAIRIIVVNKPQTSTTLVISRAKGEKETHIAWSHYLRLEPNR